MDKEVCDYCAEEFDREDIIMLPPDNCPVCMNCFRRLVEAAAPYILGEANGEARPRWQEHGF
jgi:hypothetical protein